MKKIISAIILATLLLSLLAVGASAAYTAPTIADALTIIKGFLSDSTDLALDVNNDGAVNLKDGLHGIKRVLWANDLPAVQNTQLFGTSTSYDLYTYNYCPSIMEEDDGTLHVYYCTNKGDHGFYMTYIDYIGYRTGTPNGDGTYTWSNESIVLSPSASGAWDDKHNCDPSVIKGTFKYNDTNYSYLMAYLGCTQGDINDIGLAVANNPAGPWVKVGTTPLVDYVYNEDSSNNWGVGQPSLVNKGGADSGKVWFFFTRGDINGTRTIVCDCDFSDLNNPVVGTETKLENEGLVTLDTGARSIINNADFAFDDARKVLYASSGCHPFPTSAPNFIAGKTRVTSFRFGGEDIAEITYGSASKAKWKYLATIDSEDTGFPRNHNSGLVRDEYGHTSGNILTVFYTVSEELSSYAERTYRIHSMSVVK
ncbi:MAG: hypothetical protein E7598_01790 [Ruminococcaceae bacterium]|nr:hypothetical protein [Oscillospiraceae bacterium]